MAALLETAGVAVHLQDLDMMGKAVEQSAGEPLGAEGPGSFVEEQVTDDRVEAPQ